MRGRRAMCSWKRQIGAAAVVIGVLGLAAPAAPARGFVGFRPQPTPHWGCFGYCHGPLRPHHNYGGCYGYCPLPPRPAYWGCYGYCPGPIGFMPPPPPIYAPTIINT